MKYMEQKFLSYTLEMLAQYADKLTNIQIGALLVFIGLGIVAIRSLIKTIKKALKDFIFH